MKTLESMIIGGCIVASALVGLQSLPDLQSIVVLLVGLAGLVLLTRAATNAALDALERAKPHPAPQPVAQPVSQPLEMVAQPQSADAAYWPQPPQPVAARYPQPVADDLQPLATAAQPDRNYFIGRMASMIVDPIPEDRPVPWLSAPFVEIDDDPVDLPDASVPALPLPRRAPTAAEYPLVWEAIKASSSRNGAILAVYGSKDGKTHRWVSRVADFYLRPGRYQEPVYTSEAVFRHELIGTCDMPGMVAARLGIDVDDDQLAGLMAGLDQCADCSAWYDVSQGDCPCQQEVA